MAYTSEIDKLEARYRENPKGRNFAPLADAYRKAGLIDNAVELCQSGLKLHPDYVSAHIVYARCLIDKKDDPGAEQVFRNVLALDGENIIALRVLAEISERSGRFDREVEWLTRLLAADPMNGDAAEALARAKGKAAAATKAEGPTLVVETFDGSVEVNPAAHAAAKAEGLEVQEDVELNPQQIEQVEIEGLAHTQYEGSGMFKLDGPPPPEAAEGAEAAGEAMPQVDLPLIMPEDLPAGVEARALAPPPPPQPPAPLAPPPPPAPPPVPAAVALSDDDGAADTAALSRAEPVLTETMAELYLKQGHQEDALRVYQALLAKSPADARLQRKVEHLSGAVGGGGGGRKPSGVSAQAFLKGILSGRGAPAPAAPSEPTTLSAAFDAAEATESPPGEPTHPAEDHISLDSVFGEEAARRAPAPETGESPSAAPAASSPPSSPPPEGGGFSFDDFFRGGAPSGAAPPAADEGRTPGRSSGRTQRPPEEEGEADQFQQWLKKLKS